MQTCISRWRNWTRFCLNPRARMTQQRKKLFHLFGTLSSSWKRKRSSENKINQKLVVRRASTTLHNWHATLPTDLLLLWNCIRLFVQFLVAACIGPALEHWSNFYTAILPVRWRTRIWIEWWVLAEHDSINKINFRVESRAWPSIARINKKITGRACHTLGSNEIFHCINSRIVKKITGLPA